MSKLDNPFFRSEYTYLNHPPNELENWDPKKATQMNDIPVKIIQEKKNCSLYHTPHLQSLIVKFHFFLCVKKC